MEPDDRDDFEEDPVEAAQRRGREKRAATKIQALARRVQTKKRLPSIVWQVYTKKFDPEFNMYFYYNLNKGESSWEPPSILGSSIWTENEIESGLCLQRAVRVFLAQFCSLDLFFSLLTLHTYLNILLSFFVTYHLYTYDPAFYVLVSLYVYLYAYFQS